MSRLILTLSTLLLAATALVAQPNLGEVTIPTPSKQITLRIASADGVTPGDPGVGVVWDFTNLNVLNDSLTRTYLLPQELDTDLQEQYPTATFGIQVDTSTNVYERTETTVRWLGSKTPSAQAMASAGDPYDTRPVEIVFNEQFNDTYRGTFTPQGAPGSFERTGSISLVYDGFGTLRLPDNVTFENVARVLTNQSSVDSLQVGPNLIEIRRQDSRATFMSPTSDSIYMVISSQTVSRFRNGEPDGEIVSQNRVLYLGTDNTTSVHEDVSSAAGVYPNPVTGNSVTVSGTAFEPASVTLVSLDGSTIPASSYELIGNDKTRINLPSVTPGMYLVQVRSDCSAGPCRRVDASIVITR